MSTRSRDYLALLAMTLLPLAAIPCVLAVVHGCAPSRHEQPRGISLPGGSALTFEDHALDTDDAFHASAANPVTHAFGPTPANLYRCTPSSAAAEVRAELVRQVSAYLDAYPQRLQVTVHRYTGYPLSFRGDGRVSLGWFVHEGRIVVADAHWEISRLFYNAEDTGSLPADSVDRDAKALANLGAP